MGGFAWVTLATNDSYSLGALVLAHSLKQSGTVHQLAVLVTPGVTNAMREKLASVFNLVQDVNILDSRDEANLRLLKRPELGVTFTKLHCWRLTQYKKCVFLDADTLVLQNSDELFDREELSAAPDVGWPDCFNSGVFVYRPSLETYDKLIAFALEKGSFDGGDQGLLNLFFSDWAHKDISKHLPFIYNLCSTACYSYLPAYKQFGSNAKIIHFIGASKPWLQYFNTETRQVQPSGDVSHLQDVLQRWWNIFCSLIHPQLSPAMPQGQSQYGVSQSYNPPQYVPPPVNPTSSADDYENAWDPWDEYDQKLAQNSHYINVSTHYDQNQPFESLNTCASVAESPTIHSQSQSYNTCSTQNNCSYEPPQPVHHYIHREPTPPPPPVYHHVEHQVEHHHHQPEVHHYVPQIHQECNQYQEHPPHYSHNQHHHQSNVNQSHEHQTFESGNSHSVHSESSVPTAERPRSPDCSSSVPILPKECEATTTVSNDISLSNTIEESTQEGDAGLAGAFAQLTLGVPRTQEQEAFESLLRKQAWEVGNIDYLGRDSFENIWSKITETLNAGASAPPPPPAAAPAESQSQSAPAQEEAKPDEPPIIPVDIPTDSSTSLDNKTLESAEPIPVVETIKPDTTEPESQAVPPPEPIPEVTETEKPTPPPVSEQIVEKEVVPVLSPELKSSEKTADQTATVSVSQVSEPTAKVPDALKETVSVAKAPAEIPKQTESSDSPIEVTPEKTTASAPAPQTSEKTESQPVSKTTKVIKKVASKSAAKEVPDTVSPKEAPSKATPPAAEKPKQTTSGTAEASEATSAPTPPPRKTDKPKKIVTKPKK
ncbi:hypothetical protein GWI33_001425 [Rhynchophorus ferrugineus]|uniref:glycogenin glucosyltransferase n=1 Tax=Rhynchophorus ferrugineus TaxID=354439 RepID=A0A834J3D0_RHYFE|nr:hypothetical protein GWI33_001425 [Rhynchophorus ferrugineus]